MPQSPFTPCRSKIAFCSSSIASLTSCRAHASCHDPPYIQVKRHRLDYKPLCAERLMCATYNAGDSVRRALDVVARSQRTLPIECVSRNLALTPARQEARLVSAPAHRPLQGLHACVSCRLS